MASIGFDLPTVGWGRRHGLSFSSDDWSIVPPSLRTLATSSPPSCLGSRPHASVALDTRSFSLGGGEGLDGVRVSLSRRTHTRCICSEWGVEPRSKGGKEPHLPPSLRGWPLPVRRGCVCLVGCGDGGAQGGEDAHAPLFTRWATSRPTFGSNRVCRRHHGAHRQPDLRTALLQEGDAHPHGGTRRSW